MDAWQAIETLPPPGERPGRVFVIVEGSKSHSGVCWRRQEVGIAATQTTASASATLPIWSTAGTWIAAPEKLRTGCRSTCPASHSKERPENERPGA